MVVDICDAVISQQSSTATDCFYCLFNTLEILR